MMEHLPMEMVIEITKHLSVKEIVICCAVSREWRDIFGSDMVWRQFCGEMTDEHLKTTPCRIKPKFESPEAKNTTLSPIGHWRMAYMRKVHLLKNWIRGNGNYVEIGCEGKVQSFFFLTNDLLIICYTGFIVLMDTRGGSPVRVARIDLDEELFGDDYNTIEVRSDLFVIRRNNVAQAIQVDLDAYDLTVKHTFYIDDGGVPDWFYADVAVGNVLLMIGRGVHIWDVEKASQLKLELCPNGGTFRQVICSKFCQDVILIVEELAGLDSDYCVIYSVKELKFLQFRLLCHGRYSVRYWAIIKNYLAVCFGRTTKVYNYVNSQLLFTFHEQFYSVGALSTTFIFLKYAEVVSFHPHSGAIVRSNGSQGDFDAYLHESSKLKWTLHKLIDKRLEIEPCDYVKLPTTCFTQYVKLTPAHSKAVVKYLYSNTCRKRLLIYYFW